MDIRGQYLGSALERLPILLKPAMATSLYEKSGDWQILYPCSIPRHRCSIVDQAESSDDS